MKHLPYIHSNADVQIKVTVTGLISPHECDREKI